MRKETKEMVVRDYISSILLEGEHIENLTVSLWFHLTAVVVTNRRLILYASSFFGPREKDIFWISPDKQTGIYRVDLDEGRNWSVLDMLTIEGAIAVDGLDIYEARALYSLIREKIEKAKKKVRKMTLEEQRLTLKQDVKIR